MKYSHTSLPALLILLLLSACGFQPLYGNIRGSEYQSTVPQQMNSIALGNIPDREGQFLRNALIDRLHINGTPSTPRYSLGIAPINESTRDLDITKDSDATRAQLSLASTMILSDNQTGKRLLERNIRAITSYNILQSQFTTSISEQNTRENALNDLAQQIENHLVLYFNR